MKRKYRISIAEHRRTAAKAVERSSYLWLSVNKHIMCILGSRRSREWILKQLEKNGGKRGDKTLPACCSNYRSAATAIRLDHEMGLI